MLLLRRIPAMRSRSIGDSAPRRCRVGCVDQRSLDEWACENFYLSRNRALRRAAVDARGCVQKSARSWRASLNDDVPRIDDQSPRASATTKIVLASSYFAELLSAQPMHLAADR